MTKNDYTVAILSEGQLRKITKVIFGRDGSYMVAVPYHSAKKGVLFKAPVVYSPVLDEERWLPYKEFIDAGELDEKRVKLSHHPSGLVQFSGRRCFRARR